MSSINTNASAMTALKTLQQTNKALETTQNHISTGYRVASASDNAAYWSIATTMRSDNKSLSTVQDALGLGAATVDVAYTAMDAVNDTLDEIKTKLVAAKQPGIDKSKIQTEISQLQDQLKTYASSANFSGSNWLSVDSSSSDYSATAQVVSSFTRDSSGILSVGTVNISIGKTSLFDSSASKSGLLEAGQALDASTVGNVVKASAASGTASKAATVALGGTTFASSTFDADDEVSFSVALDGGAATTVTIDKSVVDAALSSTDGVVANADDMAKVVSKALENASLTTVSAKNDGGTVKLTGTTTGSDKTIEISDVKGASAAISGNVAAASDSQAASTAASVDLGTFAALTFGDDDTLSFDVTVDDGSAVTVTIDKSVVDTALSTTDGVVDTSAKLATVLTTALTTAGINSDVTAADASGTVTLTRADSTNANSIAISDGTWTSADATNVAAGTGNGVSLDGAKLALGTFAASTFEGDDQLVFNVTDDGKETQVVINKATVDAALGNGDGAIADADDMVSVMNQALSDAGLTGVTAAKNDAGAVELTSTAGALSIDKVRSSDTQNTFDIATIDITNASDADLDNFINGVDKMAQSVTTAASDLGAVKSRIGLQTDFIGNLMDAVDRGVGQLVDADMNEESTKLQALQVQQQLGIQALSIANQNSQTILSLFR